MKMITRLISHSLRAIILLCAIFIGSIRSDKQYFCENLAKYIPIQNDSALAFVLNPPGDRVFACPSGYVSISCCMTGYKNIVWEEFIQPSDGRPGSWHSLFLKGIDARYLEEGDQTFVINRVEGDRDETFFRCTGFGVHGDFVINEIRLTVEDCSVDLPLTFFDPADVDTTAGVILGQSKVMKCVVFVGSSENCDNTCVTWFRRQQYSNGTLGAPSNMPEDGRFAIIVSREEKMLIERSLLIINSTQKDDFNWVYFCDTFQPDMPDKHRSFRLEIQQAPSQDAILHWIVLTFVATTSVIVVAVVVIYKFNVEIQVWYKTRIKKRPILQDQEYHVFLLHTNESREDRAFALQVVRPYLLDDLNYRVFSENDINFGEDFLDRYAEGVENSCVLVVVISKELLEDESCKMCIRDAISLGRNIIYIVRKLPSDDGESIRDILVALRTGTKITWPQEDDEEVEVTACQLQCFMEPNNQICREIQSPTYCKNKLQLYLLRCLENKERRQNNCVCLNTYSESNIEQHPIVSTSMQNVC